MDDKSYKKTKFNSLKRHINANFNKFVCYSKQVYGLMINQDKQT